MLPYATLLGLLLNLAASLIYWRDMFRGTTKPNRISSGFWALSGGIAIAAALCEGVTWAAVPTLAGFFGPFITILLSFFLKQAAWKLGPSDWGCGILAIMALVLWKITANPNVAIFFAILADFSAAIPTLVKSWTHPETETGIAWVLPVPGYMTSFLALNEYSFAEMAFSGYSALVCGVISLFVYTGPYRKRLAIC